MPQFSSLLSTYVVPFKGQQPEMSRHSSTPPAGQLPCLLLVHLGGQSTSPSHPPGTPPVNLLPLGPALHYNFLNTSNKDRPSPLFSTPSLDTAGASPF